MRRINTQFIISYSKIIYNRFKVNFIGEFNMELNYALIGARIKKIRKAQKITQDKLSELAGISPQHLSQIESAKTKLSLPALINICNALNVTTDKVLCDVLTADTAEQINEDIAEVFKDCTADEIYLMLSVAENLKKSIRLKKIKLSHD
ncbi:MAG: helix-turn-helix transcriptional regulator [Oscillospiraceae bacterium]|nr:helix-turn-helix transcriptional regulator [Oscillospiraceae bacterium]